MFAIYSTSSPINNFEQTLRNDAYCQNIYWHPNALVMMEEAGCDLKAVEDSIFFVKSGRFGNE